MVEGITAQQYPMLRDKIWPHLERLERHDKDGQTAEEYEEKILARDLQVWSLNEFEAIAVTTVSRDAVRLEWVVGRNRHNWQEDLDKALRSWATHLGKKRILVTARPGWASFAKKTGYREAYRTYEAKLNGQK